MLTGASALLYEIVWLRRLVLIVGSTTAAVSTVLGVFMVGLGAGAWAFGRAADRSRNPLKLYAWLEAATGLYALVLPQLFALAGGLYVSLARGVSGDPAALLALRVLIGFLLLLPPTLCMGGTLPALLRCLGKDAAELGRSIGSLYAANLAGAVVGALLTGFVLIRELGLHGASMVAVCVNLGVSLLALAAAGRLPARDAGPAPLGAPEAGGPLLTPTLRRLLWAVVFASGLTSMAYEVLWTRMLIFSLTSTVYSFALILATFLSGLALGAELAGFAEARYASLRTLAVAQIGAGLAAALLSPTSARAWDLIQALSARLGHSGGVFLLGSLCSALLLILLPATLMGVVFPISMRLLSADLQRASRQVGSAYLVNTLGAVVGSFGAGFVLLPLLGLKWAVLALALVQVVSGWALLPWTGLEPSRRRRVLLATGAALAAVLAGASLLLPGASPFDPVLRPGSDFVLEAHHDSATASVSVVRRGDERTLRIDGFDATTTAAGSGYMPMMAHLPLLLHPEPRRVLVICFGTGSTAGTTLLYPGVALDAVDIDATVFRFAPFFRRANRNVAESPRARLLVDDGRNFLLTASGRYDVITLEPMPPRFAGVVNLYSREYYALASERLQPGGFVVQWLPVHLVDVAESLAILRTVQDVFSETTLWFHGGTGLVVARRDRPVTLERATLERRFADAALAADLARLGVPDTAAFADLHMLGPAALRQLTRNAPAITDDRPSLEYHKPSHRAAAHVAGVNADQLAALETFLRARRPDDLPLAGFAPEEAARLRAFRDAATYLALGDMYRSVRLWQPARAAYEQGLPRAPDERSRERLLSGLAALPQQDSNRPR